MSTGKNDANSAREEPPVGKRIRILFISEAATLAHVIRPLVLARGLSQEDFEITFAGGNAFATVFRPHEFRQLPLASRSPTEFARILSKGGVIFDQPTLQRYVEEELLLFASENPDIVVGDLRPSQRHSVRVP